MQEGYSGSPHELSASFSNHYLLNFCRFFFGRDRVSHRSASRGANYHGFGNRRNVGLLGSRVLTHASAGIAP